MIKFQNNSRAVVPTHQILMKKQVMMKVNISHQVILTVGLLVLVITKLRIEVIKRRNKEKINQSITYLVN
jgi:hypothetical protein